MSNEENAGTDQVTGEVVGEARLSDGQSIKKEYQNCAPLELADEPGRYTIVRVGDAE